jgi:O-antigen ligase
LTVLSRKWSIYPEGAETVIGNVTYAMILNWCMAEYIYQGKRDFSHLCAVIEAMAMLLALNFLLNRTLENGRYSLGTGVEDEGVNANTVGMIAAMMCGVLLFGAKKSQWKKWHYNIMIAVLTVIALLTGSRKALLIILLFMVAFVFFWQPEKQMGKFLARLLISVGIATVVIFLLMKIDVLYDTIGNRLESLYLQWFTGAEADESALSRAKMVEIGMNIFRKKPWIGFGHNAFKLGSGYETYSHNNYVELLCSLGILGAALYYIPMICFTVKAFRMWRNGVPGAIFPLSILVIQFITDFGQVSYYGFHNNIFLGVAVGYLYLLKDNLKKGLYDDVIIQKGTGRKNSRKETK